MTDPYETLGVPRDATPADIKKAFRKKARKSHPDSNPGDETAASRFDAVKKATDLLLDPGRRERFDRTGDSSEERLRPEHGMDFADVVGGALDNVLRRHGDRVDKVNILAAVVTEVKSFRRQIEDKIATVEKELKRVRKALGRVCTKGDAPNLIEGIVLQRVQGLEETIESGRKELDRMTRALKYLEGCECSGESPDAATDVFGLGVLKWTTTRV